MRCIFCKSDSSNSRSIEHIIPESLGNTDAVLPAGVVCDSCNNYFARKIEGPLLASLGFQSLRGRQGIGNKRGKIPPISGYFPKARIEIAMERDQEGDMFVYPSRSSDNALFSDHIKKKEGGSFIIPTSMTHDDRTMGRFLGKVGLETLAKKFLEIEGWNDEIVDKEELDLLRKYVRLNDGVTWPINKRRIYSEDFRFDDGSQVLHEVDILLTDENEYYVVVCIFGMEYVLNLGGPELDGYQKWLKQNNERSPLYPNGLPA